MNEESLAQKYKDEGNKEFKAGNYTQAIEHYTKAINAKKEKTFYTNRANCFYNLNKFNKCISDCDEALKLDEKFSKAYYRKADAQMTLGLIKEAVDTMNKAIENKVDDEEMRKKLQEAKIQLSYRDDYDAAYAKKDWDTCIRKLDCLLEKCSHYRELIVKKIEILCYLGKVQEAIDMVKKYQPEYSSFSDFKWASGLAYVYKGQTDFGLNIWKEGNQADQDYVRFRESVKKWKTCNQLKEEGTELFKQNKYDQALQKYRQAAEVDEYNRTFNAAVYMNIGTCLMKQSKHKEAIREFNKCIEFNPSYGKAYMKRGNCQEILEKYSFA